MLAQLRSARDRATCLGCGRVYTCPRADSSTMGRLRPRYDASSKDWVVPSSWRQRLETLRGAWSAASSNDWPRRNTCSGRGHLRRPPFRPTRTPVRRRYCRRRNRPVPGSYFVLSPEAAARCRSMIYPVPDPRLPFLGVHVNRRPDGHAWVGPNAVLALAREGYRRRDLDLRDVRDVVGTGAFWRLARRHWRAGVIEVTRDLVPSLVARAVRRFLPDVVRADLIPGSRRRPGAGALPGRHFGGRLPVRGEPACAPRPERAFAGRDVRPRDRRDPCESDAREGGRLEIRPRRRAARARAATRCGASPRAGRARSSRAGGSARA